MLEPHLKRNAGASQKDVGIVFMLRGFAYMIMSPTGGWVCLQV